MTIRPFMAARRRFVTAGAAAALAGCARGPAALRPTPDDGVTLEHVPAAEWPTAAPRDLGLDAAALDAVLADAAATSGLRSLVVVRDGALVAEGYWRGATEATLLPVASVTKSVASMLAGIALGHGRLGGSAALERRVAELLPEAAARAGAAATTGDVTLGSILAGRSGVAFDVFAADRLARAADPVQFALTLPRVAAPPSGWTYNDPLVGLLAPILERSEGADLVVLAERGLFAPLGIRRFAWRRDALGRPMSYGGLALRTRDLAKLGWVIAAQGRWRERDVVPAAWAARSITPHGPADWRLPPLRDIGYGDLWFTGSLDGRPLAWAWGYGGQFALVAPQQRLVVATAASAPRLDELGTQTNAIGALVARVVRAAG